MEQHTLTVIGDSIAAGLGDPVPGHPNLPWADQLAATLGVDPDAGFRNLGVVGARLDEIVGNQLPIALAPAAEVTVLTGGGNDVLAPVVEWNALERLLDSAIGRLRSTGSRVVTFGLFDVTCTDFVPDAAKQEVRRRIARLNELTASATERHGGTFVDFFDHPDQSPAIFSADGLHPNRRAHRLIAAEVVDALVGVAGRRR